MYLSNYFRSMERSEVSQLVHKRGKLKSKAKLQYITYSQPIHGLESDMQSLEKLSITYCKLPTKQCSKKPELEMKVVPGEHAAREIYSCK